ncbi:hypothetical protein N9K85_06350 [Flavobacteriaceae bacterium]|nr:hypothetical protein [Flavobacteriaceae bacterium]
MSVASIVVGLIIRKKGETLKESFNKGADNLLFIFLFICLSLMAIGFLVGVGELIIPYLERIWL